MIGWSLYVFENVVTLYAKNSVASFAVASGCSASRFHFQREFSSAFLVELPMVYLVAYIDDSRNFRKPRAAPSP
jgi:hypothetical protein